MAEYIEKNVAIARLTALEIGNPCATMTDAKRQIADTRLADVAPVVRCKDCKHFNHKRMECENEAISTDHEGGAQYSLNFWLDDFCSYGEPKEGTHADDHD